MSTTLKIFLSAAFGAFVGSLLAIQFNSFWWLGLLVGGLVGYVSYDFAEVRRAVPVAARQAASAVENPELWMVVGQESLKFLFHVAKLILFFAGLFGFAGYGVLIAGAIYQPEFFLGLWWVAAAIAGIIGLICSCKFMATTIDALSRGYWSENARRLLVLNPLTCCIAVPTWLIFSRTGRSRVSATFRTVSQLVSAMLTFAWKIFCLVHSDIRLLCGVDATIGAAVGLYFGNVLIGAVSGGIWGVINYRVVSVWWLKLVPNRA